jgi:16S rRNA (cytidine1402-2'-O)-methyltransferase
LAGSAISLTFVPTPLGNLRDITLRALDVLRDCTLVVAEDTRVARRLLTAHKIAGKRVLGYREQNAAHVTPEILALARHELVAVTSDAGMPGLSDPGRELLVAARAAGIAVEVLPGPVAFVTAAVLAGFPLVGLGFGGFLPRTSEARAQTLQTALESGASHAWYESPQRIVATLEALAKLDPAATVFVAREMTKLHEQQILGTPGQALAALERPVRGEITLVLGPRDAGAAPRRSGDLLAAIDAALDAGLSVAAAAKMLAREREENRTELYARVADRKRERSGKPPPRP